MIQWRIETYCPPSSTGRRQRRLLWPSSWSWEPLNCWQRAQSGQRLGAQTSQLDCEQRWSPCAPHEADWWEWQRCCCLLLRLQLIMKNKISKFAMPNIETLTLVKKMRLISTYFQTVNINLRLNVALVQLQVNGSWWFVKNVKNMFVFRKSNQINYHPYIPLKQSAVIRECVQS